MKKNRLSTVLLVLILLIGLSLLLYPTVSDYWNSMHQSAAIKSLNEYNDNLPNEEYERILEEAHAYNREIEQNGMCWKMTPEMTQRYWSLLNFDSNGAMGYIEIPKIGVSLAMYHGTDNNILQIGVGHIEASSLPVGGEGTHCILSGHRGLTSAKLFSNLDQMVEGDTFTLNVLDQILTYEVDQIRVVEPNDIDTLVIEPGKDYCTLVTCTPYGVNTHRMLVRGHRIDNAPNAVRVQGDALIIEDKLVAVIIGIAILVIMALGAAILPTRKRVDDDE
ncbi:MAG: class C sortase [Eubacteriales bacterium]|nr:class C sortase [Eubacteriales bacterium]